MTDAPPIRQDNLELPKTPGPKKKPSWWWVVFAGFLIIGVPMISAITMFGHMFGNMRGVLGNIPTPQSFSMVTPGAHELSIDVPGTYKLVHLPNATYGGRSPDSSGLPDGTRFQLLDADGGIVALTPAISRYGSSSGSTRGVALYEFSVSQETLEKGPCTLILTNDRIGTSRRVIFELIPDWDPDPAEMFPWMTSPATILVMVFASICPLAGIAIIVVFLVKRFSGS